VLVGFAFAFAPAANWFEAVRHTKRRSERQTAAEGAEFRPRQTGS
jgi:hypothetical protein